MKEIVFELTTTLEYGIHISEILGDLDYETYTKLESNINDIITESNSYLVLLDFSNLNGFCSAAEFVLIWASEQIKQKNGKIAICCLNQNTWELMHAFGLNKFIKLFQNKNDAILFLTS